MTNSEQLREIIASRYEWLLVRDGRRTFSLLSGEIEVTTYGKRVHFGFLDEKGFHNWRLNGFTFDNTGELTIDVAGAFARRRETMRLIPRIAAAELAAEVELARLAKANEMAELITRTFPDARLGRVALNVENGRLAQIEFDSGDDTPTAATADVTGTLTVETIISSAMLWIDRLGIRKKKPVTDIWIICEKRAAKSAQKLHALLSHRWRLKITVAEIDRKSEPPRLVLLPKRQLGELWREKAAKLSLPPEDAPTATSQRIIDLSPDSIDILYSRQGETLRFHGLPFARVRSLMGEEKAWFGIGRNWDILNGDTWKQMTALVELLAQNRDANAPNRRHELYRAAPEAWLESILRRNIKLLDANLILSPIYNQFRSSNDKIDLLALRRDGRLVIIELKTNPDREMVLQAADYWRKIELQRRRGVLDAADLFDGREIADRPAIVYLAAPAWSFHREFEYFARALSPRIELWRFELHQNWRERVRVLARESYSDGSALSL